MSSLQLIHTNRLTWRSTGAGYRCFAFSSGSRVSLPQRVARSASDRCRPIRPRIVTCSPRTICEESLFGPRPPVLEHTLLYWP